ncbi:hypothetical protein TVAG_227010 [Trichomonas vaginalis G3]|uniref:Uncharacterized protein n=1 Tax=Trichomonas vaginalis (strain ATCC PRA-98 / G3) TaxID=412133 RepID=A2FFU5_TRIV3|nr:structural constituent of cuticle [Trichomonas vaginalis G3]EAX96206.1 hypothetical protein TVAG_227010 [Trichomonas vaginalis G3]KAI5496661.1 structural constituent of cuticle [Trichomonas vaginalis G3]|eukprot:XP_001309136.1 hypothetical protein [Trichomonas vaginalis G3]
MDVRHERLASYFKATIPITDKHINYARARGYTLTTLDDGTYKLFGNDEEEREAFIKILCDRDTKLDEFQSDFEEEESEIEEESDDDAILDRLGRLSYAAKPETLTREQRIEFKIAHEKELLQKRLENQKTFSKAANNTEDQPQNNRPRINYRKKREEEERKRKEEAEKKKKFVPVDVPVSFWEGLEVEVDTEKKAKHPAPKTENNNQQNSPQNNKQNQSSNENKSQKNPKTFNPSYHNNKKPNMEKFEIPSTVITALPDEDPEFYREERHQKFENRNQTAFSTLHYILNENVPKRAPMRVPTRQQNAPRQHKEQPNVSTQEETGPRYRNPKNQPANLFDQENVQKVETRIEEKQKRIEEKIAEKNKQAEEKFQPYVREEKKKDKFAVYKPENNNNNNNNQKQQENKDKFAVYTPPKEESKKEETKKKEGKKKQKKDDKFADFVPGKEQEKPKEEEKKQEKKENKFAVYVPGKEETKKEETKKEEQEKPKEQKQKKENKFAVYTPGKEQEKPKEEEKQPQQQQTQKKKENKFAVYVPGKEEQQKPQEEAKPKEETKPQEQPKKETKKQKKQKEQQKKQQEQEKKQEEQPKKQEKKKEDKFAVYVPGKEQQQQKTKEDKFATYVPEKEQKQQPQKQNTEKKLDIKTIRKSVYYLFESYSPSLTDEQVLQTEEYAVKFTDHEPQGEATLFKSVNSILADYLIECFSIQPKMTNSTTKVPKSKPITIPLLLPPSVIPVQFKNADENHVEISIFKTKQTSIEECKMLLEKAIYRLKIDFILYSYTFKKVSNEGTKPSAFAEMIKDYNCLVLSTHPPQRDVISFIVYALTKQGKDIDEKLEKIKKIYEEYFNRNKLLLCKHCHSAYIEGDDSVCIEYYHPGMRIPLESGLMEKELEVDGETKKLVNYACCGTCYLDDPGCQQKLNLTHTEESEVSEFLIENEVF